MICSSLCRVPFIAVPLLRFGRTHILDWYSFRGLGQQEGKYSLIRRRSRCILWVFIFRLTRAAHLALCLTTVEILVNPSAGGDCAWQARSG